MTITDTDAASIHSIRRAEIFTSRQAIQTETAVTSTASSTAEKPWPVASLQQQVGVVIEAADHAGACGDVSQQQTPGHSRAQPRRKNHRSVGIQRAGRGRIAREACDAQRHQQHGDGGEHVSEPRAVSRRARTPAEWSPPAWWWAPWWRPTAPASPSAKEPRAANRNLPSGQIFVALAPSRARSFAPRKSA